MRKLHFYYYYTIGILSGQKCMHKTNKLSPYPIASCVGPPIDIISSTQDYYEYTYRTKMANIVTYRNINY